MHRLQPTPPPNLVLPLSPTEQVITADGLFVLENARLQAALDTTVAAMQLDQHNVAVVDLLRGSAQVLEAGVPVKTMGLTSQRLSLWSGKHVEVYNISQGPLAFF